MPRLNRAQQHAGGRGPRYRDTDAARLRRGVPIDGLAPAETCAAGPFYDGPAAVKTYREMTP
jgi:hypothetical protein